MIKTIIGDHLESNVFIYEKEDSCIIIDCGASLEKIKNIVGKNKVEGIFLTHGHYDHSLFVNDYQEYFKCPIYANNEITKTLEDGDANYGNKTIKILNKDKLFLLDGDGIINLKNFTINYYHCPGHSLCCECYLVDGILFAGDVLFNRSIGRTDLKFSDKNSMFNSLCKLERLEFNLVKSGHDRDSSYQEQMKNIQVFKKFLKR